MQKYNFFIIDRRDAYRNLRFLAFPSPFVPSKPTKSHVWRPDAKVLFIILPATG